MKNLETVVLLSNYCRTIFQRRSTLNENFCGKSERKRICEQEAQSYCDIFRQIGAEIIDRRRDKIILEKTQMFRTITPLYVTLLVFLQLWCCTKLQMPKRKEAGSPSGNERQKPQRLYTQCGAACGSVRNLVKASNLLASKMRPFLHSKPQTKFILATHQFKRMKDSTRFKYEIWCTDLANVDKLAKK